ncbi:hypothetical protein N2152v2_006078 [Parachlorella kessleri]
MASEISRERFARKNETAELKRAFDFLDKNKDGKIDAEELAAYFTTTGHKMKKAEIDDMIWEVDEDCDQKVNWEEFQCMHERCRDDKTGTEPRQLFNVVQFVIHDLGNSGKVTLEEAMKLTYLRFGRNELDAQLEAVFGTADINSGKTLTLTEFMQSLQASQIKQLRNRPTMKQTMKQAAAATAGGQQGRVSK